MLAFSLLPAALGCVAAASAEPPKIGGPRPAPPSSTPDLPPLPPAVFDPTLAIGGEDVKARKVETRLNVDVQLNGRGPYRFIVDSGADTSVVGLRVAHDLQLPLGSPVILNAMNARDLVDRVKVDELGLGKTVFSNLQLPVLREEDVGGDGMIGIDALVEQRLMLDFEKKVINVEDARIPEKHLPGEIVVYGRRRRGQLILTHVTAAGLPLDAVIDTGSEVTIGNLALRNKLRRQIHGALTIIPGVDVTGTKIDLEIAVIDELQLGPILFRDVPIAFAEVAPFKLFGLSDEPALLLGTDLLENFRRVSLDFRARKVRFQLARCHPQVVLLSTSSAGYTRLSSTGEPDVCG